MGLALVVAIVALVIGVAALLRTNIPTSDWVRRRFERECDLQTGVDSLRGQAQKIEQSLSEVAEAIDKRFQHVDDRNHASDTILHHLEAKVARMRVPARKGRRK